MGVDSRNHPFAPELPPGRLRVAYSKDGMPKYFSLWAKGLAASGNSTALETTQGQIHGFFSQIPYKCHQNRVASVGD